MCLLAIMGFGQHRDCAGFTEYLEFYTNRKRNGEYQSDEYP